MARDLFFLSLAFLATCFARGKSSTARAASSVVNPFRPPLQSRRPEYGRETCSDAEKGCAKWGDKLFAPDGKCMAPLDELCVATCGLCEQLYEYAACRSPVGMDAALSHVPPDQGQGINSETSRPDLMKAGGPRRLFESMAARLGVNITAQRPLLIEVDSFLSPSEAAVLVKLADDLVQPETDMPQTVRNVSKMDCEDLSCMLNPAVINVYRKVEQLVQLPAGNFESLEFLRYRKDNFYKAHDDSGEEEQFHPGGPRYLTAFVYLSELPEGGGGGTLFPNARFRVVPKIGKLVIWSNVKESTPWIDEEWALHKAEKVKSGTKYAFNLWIHPRNVRLVGIADGHHRCMPDLH